MKIPSFLSAARNRRLRNLRLTAVLAVSSALVIVGVHQGWTAQKSRNGTAFELTTPAFKSGGDIPRKFTCDGANVSPALTWTEPPAGTKSLVLIADDPDAPAGIWVHWVIYDLPAGFRQLPEGMPRDQELRDGGRQGLTDFGRTGYGGPCPPPGKPHRYFFKLYALDVKLNLKAGATKQEVERAMNGHVLAQAQRVGHYRR